LVLRSARLSKKRGDEALGNSLLSSEGLVALEPSDVGKSRLDGMLDSLACPNGRVVHIPGARSSGCGSSRRTNRCHMCFERRVRGCRISAIAR
jgi:hypothetical protein